MRKVKLYIAISVDGKIADENGGVDWLDQVPNPEESDYGYTDFTQSIDTTIMGNSTYQQVLSFPVPFPYADYENYVFTRNKNLNEDEHAKFISSDFEEFIGDLKKKKGKDIWLIGGAEIISLIHELSLIDEYLIFVMPVVLGNGISLFSGHPKKADLKLIEAKNYPSGVTLLHYRKVEITHG